MKYLLTIGSVLAIVFLAVVTFSTPAGAVITPSWSCKLAANVDGTCTSETWGNLRKPIYFTETQAHYIIEREGDTLLKPNTGQPWLPYKSLNCTKTS